MELLELFTYALKQKSVTPDDGGLLDFFTGYLEDFNAVRLDKNGVKNLFLYKKFGEGEHLCFAGHVDVVPAGEGWSSDPFTPTLRDGYIYARGTQDMKSGVVAAVQALKGCKEFEGTLSLLLTSDEEGEAEYGTKIVLEYLKQHNLLPDYAVVAEPTCEDVFGDAIKIGRRGSINGYLTLYGKQGHAAYPEKSINPIHLVAKLLGEFAGVELDSGDDFFAPSKLVVTDIRSGMQVTNVTPDKLEIMFNVRNNTRTTQKEVTRHIEEIMGSLQYKLKLTQGSYPFMTNSDTKVVKKIDEAIWKVTGVRPRHSTAGGTSDARFMAPCGIDVIEFGVKNDTIHSVDERTHESEVVGLYEVFVALLKGWNTK